MNILNIIDLIKPFGGYCGYCETEQTAKATEAFRAHCLEIEFYQYFQSLAWSRCGTFIWRPLNHIICCPQVTLVIYSYCSIIVN